MWVWSLVPGSPFWPFHFFFGIPKPVHCVTIIFGTTGLQVRKGPFTTNAVLFTISKSGPYSVSDQKCHSLKFILKLWKQNKEIDSSKNNENIENPSKVFRLPVYSSSCFYFTQLRTLFSFNIKLQIDVSLFFTFFPLFFSFLLYDPKIEHLISQK